MKLDPSVKEKDAKQSEIGLENSAIEKKKILAEILRIRRLWPYFGRFKYLVVITAALVPLIALFSSAPAVVLKYIIDKGVLAKDTDALLMGAAFYLGIVFLDYLCQVCQSLTAGIAVQQMSTTLRAKLVHHVLTRPAKFHDRNMSGALVTRATGDFENLAQSLNQGILTSVADLAKLTGIVAGMFYLGWEFGVISIVVIAVGSGIMGWFSKKLREAMMLSRKYSSEMNAFGQELLYNSFTVKHISGEAEAANKFDVFNEKNRRSLMNEVTHDANLYSFLDGISAVCIGGALYYVLAAHGQTSQFTAGTLVAFVQYMFQVFEPLKALGNKVAMLQGVFTAVERIFGVLDVADTISGGQESPSLSGSIEVRDLCYRYSESAQSPLILDNVSFSILPGQSLAVVGRTGSGKSTIVRLLTKMYDGYQGHILFDGHELSDLSPASVRRQMAVVSQDVVLFNDTVDFNVTLGTAGVSRQQVINACILSGADRFIDQLPGGYDFVVSEKGENLSQGQKQLISLARALLHEPRILVLDEATSSVDPEAEKIFQNAIENILGKCTVIVIAHRVETIEKCNFVLVLEKGRVVEHGSFDDLVAKQGAFYKLKVALSQSAQSDVQVAQNEAHFKREGY